jgi:zinc protease
VQSEWRTQLVSVALVVGGGAAADPPGKEGLSNYLQRLTVRARPTGQTPFEELVAQAGAIGRSSSTGSEYSWFSEDAPVSRLKELLTLAGLRMTAPLANLTDADRARELLWIRNQARSSEDGERLASLRRAILGNSPGARPRLGTSASLAAIQPGDIDEAARAQFRPDNLTLAIVGDVDLGTVRKLIDEALPRDVREAPLPIPVPKRMSGAPIVLPEEPPATAEPLRQEALLDKEQLYMAWPLPAGIGKSRALGEFAVRWLATHALGGLGADDADVDDAMVRTEYSVHSSSLFLRIILHKGDHPKATAETVLDRIAKSFALDVPGMKRDIRAFEKIRRQLLITRLGEEESLGVRAGALARSVHFTGDPSMAGQDLEELRNATFDDFENFIGTWLTRKRARTLILVPHVPTTEELAQSLQAPIPEKAKLTRLEPGGAPGWERQRLRELMAWPADRSIRRLANGLTVILEPRPGVALLTGRLKFLAVAKTPAEVAAAQMLEMSASCDWAVNGDPTELGAWTSAARDTDDFSFSLQGSSGNTEQLLAQLSDYARGSKVTHDAWRRFRTEGQFYAARRDDTPRHRSSFDSMSAMLAGSPYGIQAGAAEREQLEMGQAVSFGDSLASPARATLFLAGDFSPVAMSALVDEWFGDWTSPAPEFVAPPPLLPTAKDRSGEVQLIVTPSPLASLNVVRFACLAAPVTTKEIGARHRIAARLLDWHLADRLRTQLGKLAGSSGNAAIELGGTSYLWHSNEVEPRDLPLALAALHQTLEEVRTEPPDATDLAWSKAWFADVMAQQQTSNWGALTSASTWIHLGVPFEGAGPAEALDAVTAEEVREDWKSCLSGRVVLAITGDDATVRAAFKAAWSAP